LHEHLTRREVRCTQQRVAELLRTGRHPEPSGEWPALPWPPFYGRDLHTGPSISAWMRTGAVMGRVMGALLRTGAVFRLETPAGRCPATS
jgi:hypothetical protein